MRAIELALVIIAGMLVVYGAAVWLFYWIQKNPEQHIPCARCGRHMGTWQMDPDLCRRCLEEVGLGP